MFRVLACLVVLVGFSGCKKGAQSLMEEQVAAMKGVTAALDTITDDNAAAAALPKLERAAARLKSANLASARTANSGGNRQVTPEEMNRAMEMVKPMMEAGLAMAASALKAQAKAPQHAAKIAAIVNSAGVDVRR